MSWYDGHSGGVTPGPIPNPAVKSARVSVCTVLRKRTGTQTRCQPLSFPLSIIVHSFIFSHRTDSSSSASKRDAMVVLK